MSSAQNLLIENSYVNLNSLLASTIPAGKEGVQEQNNIESIVDSTLLELEKAEQMTRKTLGEYKSTLVKAEEKTDRQQKHIVEKSKEAEETKKNFNKLLDVSCGVERALNDFLSEIKSSLSAEKEPSVYQTVQNALTALDGYARFLDESSDSQKPNATVDGKGKTLPRAYLLNDSKQLLTELQGLHSSLDALRTLATEAKNLTEDEVLRDKVPEHNYKELITKFNELDKPINRKLSSLEALIKEYQDKQILPEHVNSIALFNHLTPQQVGKELEKRRENDEARRKQHDELALLWSQVLIEKELVKWQMENLNIYLNIYTNAKTLSRDLSELDGKIRRFKATLREEEPKVRPDEKELEKMLVESRKAHSVLIKEYKELAVFAGQYKENAESTLRILTNQIKTEEKPLTESIAKISVYDKDVKAKIEDNLKEPVVLLQYERNKLRNMMETQWNSILKFLGDANHRDSLTYQLQRLGYAINHNKGQIPKDTLYQKPVVGWNVEEVYVRSPFAIEKQEKEKKEPTEKKDEAEVKIA